MTPTRQGSFRLFRFAGIDVFLHWSWFLGALYILNTGASWFSSQFWNALVCLSLFALVTMHEFGHALACRSVGGQANQIILWPLGGVAYVDPPQRPGAVLWSIAAGPLVNVVLFPLLSVLIVLTHSTSFDPAMPDVNKWLYLVWFINLGLLKFNLLPIYPLDGGQILRALLWYPLGRTRSLMAATVIGFIGVAALMARALLTHQSWLGLITIFIVMNCWRGWQQARMLMRVAKMPRREGFVCPSCGAGPPLGALWGCGKCRAAFDMFETQAVCPKCGTQFGMTRCLNCGALSPVNAWAQPAAIPVTPV